MQELPACRPRALVGLVLLGLVQIVKLAAEFHEAPAQLIAFAFGKTASLAGPVVIGKREGAVDGLSARGTLIQSQCMDDLHPCLTLSYRAKPLVAIRNVRDFIQRHEFEQL